MARRDWRIANLGLPRFNNAIELPAALARYSYGEVHVERGVVQAILPRWWPRISSLWDVYRDSYFKPLPTDHARFYYAFPKRVPGFLTILYVHSGPQTSYQTARLGLATMDLIAGLRSAQAIVCQATNERLSERAMNRWGYQRHALSLGNNHYIKRLRS